MNDVLDTDAWTAMTAELAMLPATPQLLIERRNLYEEMLGHYPTAVRAHTVPQSHKTSFDSKHSAFSHCSVPAGRCHCRWLHMPALS